MKKLKLEQYGVQEMDATEVIKVNGGGVFEDFGIFMGVLLYENQKLNEKMNYSGMVASFGH